MTFDWPLVLTIVGMSAAAIAGAVRIGFAISAAERRAKHDAIDALNEPLGRMEIDKLDASLYRSEQSEIKRRLGIVERRLHLNGDSETTP